MAKTSSSCWKALERAAADFFHGKRNPLSGGNSGITRADVQHPTLFIEAKLRSKSSLWTLFEQTRTLARAENKIPVIVQKCKGKHGFLITVHCDDFLKI